MSLQAIGELNHLGRYFQMVEVFEFIRTKWFALRTSRVSIDRIIGTQLRSGKDMVNAPATFTAKHFIAEVNLSILAEFSAMITSKTCSEGRWVHGIVVIAGTESVFNIQLTRKYFPESSLRLKSPIVFSSNIWIRPFFTSLYC